MNTQAQHSIEDQFAGDQQRRQRLGSIIQQVLDVAISLEMSDEQNALRELKQVVESDTFKVLILGEFNTGKSTFINALLGQEILPSYATPATAIINEIKWGDEPQALLHFHEKNKDPLAIPVDQLEDYVVIKDDTEEIRDSPYSHIELFWPIELCRNRVEVIDSPGLNESEVREQVTLNYLRKVDAVIFVMTALRLGPSLHEQETLKMLNASGHDELFFIINQFDLLRRDRDRQAVKERAFEQFMQYTRRSQENVIHCISSLDALEGRLDGDTARVETSRILPLERVLNEFLFIERSRIKCKRAAMELQLSIVRSQKVIPDKRTYLQTPLAELRQRYADAQAQFHQLKDDKNNIIRRVDRFRRDIRTLVDSKIRDFFREIEADIDGWVEEYPVQLKLNFNVEKQVSNLIEGLVDSLDIHLKDAFSAWSEEILLPFVETQVEALKRDLERLTEDFEANLRRTRLELLGRQFMSDDFLTDAGPKNAFERALAAAGGFFLLGVPGAGLGAVFGWREVVNAILPQIGVAMAASIIGLPILPIMIAAGIGQGVAVTRKLMKRIKEEVTKAYKRNLRQGVSDQSQKITQQIDQEFSKLSEQLEQGLQVQIAEVEEQVEAALLKQEEGQQAVDAKLAEIVQLEKTLSDIYAQLIEFIALIDQT